MHYIIKIAYSFELDRDIITLVDTTTSYIAATAFARKLREGDTDSVYVVCDTDLSEVL